MGLAILSTALEVAGIVLLAVAGFHAWPPLGYAVLGIGCILFGLAASATTAPPPGPRTPQDN